MSRFARNRRVFFFEEPVFDNVQPHLRSWTCPRTGVRVNTPVLPHGLDRLQIADFQKGFLKSMLEQNGLAAYVAWYYTPMAREFSSVLLPELTVYDCMDELSAFAGAPAAMRSNEENLFLQTDLVFTGGASLFESKRKQHSSVHLFPSSVDVAHFSRARAITNDPEEQSILPYPRLGYAGVIDERMDLELLRQVAIERPYWQIILLGPVVKINPASLPSASNIHYFGMKKYADLPAYLAGWQIGMLPFAMNDSTRFISPTKTPEYLAAGLQVVSTPIRDVITPYGDLALARIAYHPSEFIRAADSLLESPPSMEFRARVAQFLSHSSWDKTWSDMNNLIEDSLQSKQMNAHRRVAAATASVPVKGAVNV
jgi:hypothetical protein